MILLVSIPIDSSCSLASEFAPSELMVLNCPELAAMYPKGRILHNKFSHTRNFKTSRLSETLDGHDPLGFLSS